MNEKQLNKRKTEIKIKELQEVLDPLVKLIFFSILCAIIGYQCFIDNQQDTIKVILLGICCPWGFVVVNKIAMFIYYYIGDLINLLALITVGIFIAACLVLEIYISCYVGIIALPILFIYYIIKIVNICKQDYTREAKGEFSTRFWRNQPQSKETTIKRPISQAEKNRIIKEYSIPHTKKQNVNREFKEEKEEFYCEKCLKKISEEDYELYDCMCEDCYEEEYFYNMEE